MPDDSPAMPKFQTLADLHRERCNLLIHCKGCDHWKEKTVPQLLRKRWEPDLDLGDLSGLTIASIVERLFCSRCQSREIEWWPKRSGAAMEEWLTTGQFTPGE